MPPNWLRSILSMRVHSSQPPMKAMKQFAKDMSSDSSYSAGLGRLLDFRTQAIAEAKASPPPSDESLPRIVGLLLEPDDLLHTIARIHLQKAGPRAEPALLAAFDDPRCTWTLNPKSPSESPPAARIAKELWDIDSDKLFEHVSHQVDHPDWRIYRVAIQATVARGTEDAARIAVRKLGGCDSTASEAAAKGVEAAIRLNRASLIFLQTVLAWAEHNATSGPEHPSEWAVGFFADQGGTDALSRLRSLLTTSNDRSPHFILRALDRHGCVVEGSLLQTLIDKSRQSKGRWPWEFVAGAALDMLAKCDPDTARALAEQLTSSASDSQRRDAIDLLRRLDELPQPWEADPPPSLVVSEDDRRVLADLGLVCQAMGEIGNGGLSQLFFNQAGDHWPQMVEAFRAIGDADGASALAEAARIVSPAGASVDRTVRMKQYADLPETAESRVDALSRVFWGERVSLIKLRFMQRHRSLFQQIRRARLAAGMSAD